MRSFSIELLLVVCFCINCEKKNTTEPEQPATTGTVTDIDGNTYKTVKIGTQWWMAEDLKATHYQNGGEIMNIKNDSSWSHSISGAYCNYYNDTCHGDTYGRIYNWYAVNDSRNITPAGWHIPSDAEWQTLVNYLGGYEIAGGKMKETGTGTVDWQWPNTGATNESGFSALPGNRRECNGSFTFAGQSAAFWSTDSTRRGNEFYAWFHYLLYNSSTVYRSCDRKTAGNSVRCVKD